MSTSMKSIGPSTSFRGFPKVPLTNVDVIPELCFVDVLAYPNDLARFVFCADHESALARTVEVVAHSCGEIDRGHSEGRAGFDDPFGAYRPAEQIAQGRLLRRQCNHLVRDPFLSGVGLRGVPGAFTHSARNHFPTRGAADLMSSRLLRACSFSTTDRATESNGDGASLSMTGTVGRSGIAHHTLDRRSGSRRHGAEGSLTGFCSNVENGEARTIGSPDVPPAPLPELVAELRRAGCVFAEEEAALLTEAAESPEELAELVRRRISGTPLEHILGWTEFCGLRIPVSEGVFVPRRRTEFLVRVAASHVFEGATVVDMCCGSGAVGVALAARSQSIHLHAVDIDPVCVRCARPTVEAIGGAAHEGDLFDPLPRSLCGRVDVVVANAPYVPTDEIDLMPAEARLHEPRTALDGGSDGLDIQRRLIADAPKWLMPGGRLFIETSEKQSTATETLCRESGMTTEATHTSEFGTSVVVARANHDDTPDDFNSCNCGPHCER